MNKMQDGSGSGSGYGDGCGAGFGAGAGNGALAVPLWTAFQQKMNLLGDG